MFKALKDKLKGVISKITGEIKEDVVEEKKEKLTKEQVARIKKESEKKKETQKPTMKATSKKAEKKPEPKKEKSVKETKLKKEEILEEPIVEEAPIPVVEKEVEPTPILPKKEEKKKAGFFSKLFGKKAVVEETVVEKEGVTEVEAIIEEKPGFFEKITQKITHKKLDDDFLDNALWELELVLLENNVASDVSQKIVADIKANLGGKAVSRAKAEDLIHDSMEKTIREVLSQEPVDLLGTIKKNKKEKKPTLVTVIGFNGTGKTTNLAKLGNYLKKQGFSVVFAAGDTYRAAAIDQLEHHAERLKLPIIKTKYGADSAAVIFDAMNHAKSKEIDVVLADTAGRAHTDANLVNELKKVIRVNKPDFNFLVVEAVAGNDVVEQARIFNEVGLHGVILSKWDIDEKGGSALSVCHTLQKPIVFLGVGQEYDDLKPFKVEDVIENIFS